MKTIRTLLISLFISTVLVSAQESSEYRLKAAFIERFTRFITWDDTTKVSSPVKLGIIGGESEVFLALKKFFLSVPIQAHTVDVRNVNDDDTLSNFTILFICEDKEPYPDDFYNNLRNLNSVLLIGDSEDMATQGVMISFLIEDEKLKFCINPDEVARSGMKVSSFLLKMATIVSTELFEEEEE